MQTSAAARDLHVAHSSRTRSQASPNEKEDIAGMSTISQHSPEETGENPEDITDMPTAATASSNLQVGHRISQDSLEATSENPEDTAGMLTSATTSDRHSRISKD